MQGGEVLRLHGHGGVSDACVPRLDVAAAFPVLPSLESGGVDSFRHPFQGGLQRDLEDEDEQRAGDFQGLRGRFHDVALPREAGGVERSEVERPFREGAPDPVERFPPFPAATPAPDVLKNCLREIAIRYPSAGMEIGTGKCRPNPAVNIKKTF